MFVSLVMLAAAVPAADSKPNVLFIAVDDLNDWTGFLGGHPDVRTPNLDRLAARSVIFERAYCAVPSCNPSRTALLTGVRPWTSGVYHNPQPWREALPDAVTLPQHFMANGYKAYGAGKIFHGGYDDDASWNEYLKKSGDPQPSAEVLADPHSRAGGIVFGALDVEDSRMADHRTVSWCIEKLKSPPEEPVFLACGLYRPHMPWQVPRKYYDMYPPDQLTLPTVPEDDLADLPPAAVKMAKPDGDHANILKTDNWRYAVQAYLASISFADAELGRLLDAFDASPVANNTVIVLWGDHGWHLGEKRHWRKFALWEEATRAPLLFAGPNIEPARCGQAVDFTAVYPTLCDLAGLPTPAACEGESLLPLLHDPTGDRESPAVTTHGRGNHAVRDEEWRYIRYANGNEELYDHNADPNEWANLVAGDRPSADHQQVIDRLAAFLPAEEADPSPYDETKTGSRKYAKQEKKKANTAPKASKATRSLPQKVRN